jgi:putative transposase
VNKCSCAHGFLAFNPNVKVRRVVTDALLIFDTGGARVKARGRPTLANNARMGHPQFVLLQKNLRVGHPPVPHSTQALAHTLKHAHGRYASYWNARQSSSGHVWQGRFYSCPLDDSHLWEALRYVELNPLRAGLVAAADAWRWSSAGAHCGSATPDMMLEMQTLQTWRKRWTPGEWAQFLAAGESPSDVAALRQSTHTGRPLGTTDFVAALERSTLRSPRKKADVPKSRHSTSASPSLLSSLRRNRKTSRLSPGFPFDFSAVCHSGRLSSGKLLTFP